jgi:hypothetical protein
MQLIFKGHLAKKRWVTKDVLARGTSLSGLKNRSNLRVPRLVEQQRLPRPSFDKSPESRAPAQFKTILYNFTAIFIQVIFPHRFSHRCRLRQRPFRTDLKIRLR